MTYEEVELQTRKLISRWVLGVIVFLALVVGLWLAFGPKYRIYRQDLRGQAELREAEWTKKILIEQARAENDAATLQAEAKIKQETAKAEAEVIRARGVAESNKIIGDSLKGNEAYLRYLWIDGLNKDQNATVYIPTEAGLPILEARSK